MRLVARKQESGWLDPGASVARYVVDGPMIGRPGAELRYPVRAPDGTGATLLMSPWPFGGRRERSRYRRLAGRRAALEHPALIPIRVVTEHVGHPALIADPYPERTFADLLESRGTIAPERLVAMFAPVADALDAAHAHGLVHHALGAESLLVDRDRLLLDSFGVLAFDDDGAWGVTHGEPAYQPPEQIRGMPLGLEANVYSLAALAVHALTGAPPYAARGSAAIYSHLAVEPPKPSEHAPHLGEQFDEVIRRGMAKYPSARQSSALELLHDIAAALGVPAPAERPSPPPPRLRLAEDGERPAEAPFIAPAHGRPRAARVVAGLAIAVALALGALAGVALDPFGGDEPAAGEAPAGVAAWQQLERERSALRERLAEVETPQAQAAVARELAAAYRRAERAGGPAAGAARDAGAAYTDLAAAADQGDSAAYREAAAAVAAAEARLGG